MMPTMDMQFTVSVLPMLLATIASLAGHVRAFCECGYTTQITVNSTVNTFTFTDVIESDFLHDMDITIDTDWIRQNYSVAPSANHRIYGMNFTISNVVSNAISNKTNWIGPGTHGGDPGLQLLVAGGLPSNDLVPVAEADSSRVDLLYGSYRFGVKVPSLSGTCTSVYWYHSESQEVDIEILSEQFDYKNQVFPVNLVMQSKQSAEGIYNTVGNGNYLVANLSFDPTQDFHEYRIDFVPGNVIFYADDQILGQMNSSAIPTQPGHLVLRHWSNGDPGWTYGPPTEQAVMTVSYAKGYFNSTDPSRQSAANLRCVNPSVPGAYCPIPGASAPGSNLSSFFFSNQPNSTKNQTIYGHNRATGLTDLSLESHFLSLFIVTIFVMVFL